MKSFKKSLSIILLISSCATFGAEQSAAEREFARQQDAKNASALQNAAANDLALAAQLQQEEDGAQEEA
ncbi:MAG TPA: hypothetical protein VLH77_01530, partial [Gammaproteobacteria bacterium]|nr:hypothetical protein [Gammaproteobacteria bacterium]